MKYNDQASRSFSIFGNATRIGDAAEAFLNYFRIVENVWEFYFERTPNLLNTEVRKKLTEIVPEVIVEKSLLFKRKSMFSKIDTSKEKLSSSYSSMF